MTNKTLFVFAVAAAVVLVLAGCTDGGSDPNPFGNPTWKGNDLEPGSTYMAVADHAVRGTALTVGRHAAFLIGLALISAMPWLVIFLIPGIAFGSWEMKAEAGIILGISGMIWYFGVAFHDLGLIWWLVWLNVIPAVILAFWKTESGKIALFGFFAGSAAAYLAVQAVNMLLSGLILQPLTTAVVIFATFMVYRQVRSWEVLSS